MAILSKGMTLGYKTTAEATTYTDVPNLTSVPALSSNKERVDVTTLANDSYVYIPGLITTDDLEFGLIYDKSSCNTLYNAIKENATTHVTPTLYWQVEFPDGATFTFTGTAVLTVQGGSVNSPITATLTITLSSKITPDYSSASNVQTGPTGA